MSKNLLHQTKIQCFLDWCRDHGHTVREGRGAYQMAQILPKGSKEWKAIYSRDNAGEHCTVDRRIDGLVQQFLKETRA